MSKMMLKPIGGTPPSWVNDADELAGAYYYANGGSVSTYRKASVVITLPTRKRLKGTGGGRNAFISLGVSASEGALDIGIRNRGLGGGGDNGFGWHPYCIECAPVDRGYYYDGRADNGFPTQSAHYAPSTAKKAKVEIEPIFSTSARGNSIRLVVEWLDGNGAKISGANHLNQVITLSRTYTWAQFYRFASLVTTAHDASMRDSTYMIGGAFDMAKLGNAGNTNWGINSSAITSAWIINNPKCAVPTMWDVGEDFKIDHWA